MSREIRRTELQWIVCKKRGLSLQLIFGQWNGLSLSNQTIFISRRTNADAAYIECEFKGKYVLFYIMILVQTFVQVSKFLASRYYVNEISLNVEVAEEGLAEKFF